MAKPKKTALKVRPAVSGKRHGAGTAVRRKIGPKVKWVEVDYIEAMREHGVEFYHVASPRTVLAFIVGCEFMHRSSAIPTVEILRAHPGRFASAVRNTVRRKVLSVVRQRGRCRWWGFRGQIGAVVNG